MSHDEVKRVGVCKWPDMATEYTKSVAALEYASGGADAGLRRYHMSLAYRCANKAARKRVNDAGRDDTKASSISSESAIGKNAFQPARARALPIQRNGIVIYMLYEHATGLKYIGQTESSVVVRFIKHCTTCKMPLVSKRLRTAAAGIRGFSVYQIGRAYSREAANKAEAFFMAKFETLNLDGLNIECHHAPELMSDFELDMEEPDLTPAFEFLESAGQGGRVVTGRDIEEFEMSRGYYMGQYDHAAVPTASKGRVLTADETQSMCSVFSPFPPTLIQRLESSCGLSTRSREKRGLSRSTSRAVWSCLPS
jgi:hypothetical protein